MNFLPDRPQSMNYLTDWPPSYELRPDSQYELLPDWTPRYELIFVLPPSFKLYTRLND